MTFSSCEECRAALESPRIAARKGLKGSKCWHSNIVFYFACYNKAAARWLTPLGPMRFFPSLTVVTPHNLFCVTLTSLTLCDYSQIKKKCTCDLQLNDVTHLNCNYKYYYNSWKISSRASPHRRGWSHKIFCHKSAFQCGLLSRMVVLYVIFSLWWLAKDIPSPPCKHDVPFSLGVCTYPVPCTSRQTMCKCEMCFSDTFSLNLSMDTSEMRVFPPYLRGLSMFRGCRHYLFTAILRFGAFLGVMETQWV